MFYEINANKNVELLFFRYENIQTESTEIAVEFRILYNNDNSKLQFHVSYIYFSLRKMAL